MNRGWWQGLVAAAALTGAGCFNPSARDETGTTTAATSGAPDTTTTGSTTDPPGTTLAPEDTTTTRPSPTSTGESTTDDGTTTAGPPAEFVARTPIAFTGAYGIVTADLNEDAALDLVVSSAAASNLVFGSYLGPDLETFTAQPSGVAVAFTGADLQLDGDTDIFAALIGTPAVIAGYRRVDPIFLNSQGTVLPEPCKNPNWLAVAQLNPGVDMYLDAVVACTDLDGGVLIVPGALNGGFDPPKAFAYGATVASVGLAQVRGSPALDLVLVSNLDNLVLVVPGADDLAFDPMLAQVIPVSAPFSVAFAALDDDEFTDFAVASQAGGCPLFHGAATFLSAPEIHPCGVGPVDLALGDLNRDSLTDLVSVHPGELHIAYGEADGGLGSPDVLGSAAAPWRVALGDYDGDTRPDIALTAVDEVHVFLQTSG